MFEISEQWATSNIHLNSMLVAMFSASTVNVPKNHLLTVLQALKALKANKADTVLMVLEVLLVPPVYQVLMVLTAELVKKENEAQLVPLVT